MSNYAIEVQLSTTQIPIILAREDFYKNEGRYLVWLTWNFEPVERRRLLTSFEDIFYSHNKNLFSLDSEIIKSCHAGGAFRLRAFWEGTSGWESKITTLRDLTWPSSGLPFAVAPPAHWDIEFRQRWLAVATSVEGRLWSDRQDLLAELAQKLELKDVSGSTLDNADIGDLIDAILSFTNGRPVGSQQRNLIELINTFLSTERRYRFARLIRTVISATSGDEILCRSSVATKFARANLAEQDGPESIAGQVALRLFPEILKKNAQLK